MKLRFFITFLWALPILSLSQVPANGAGAGGSAVLRSVASASGTSANEASDSGVLTDETLTEGVLTSGALADEAFTDDSTKLSMCEHLRDGGRVTVVQDSRLETLVGCTPKVYNGVSHLKTTRQGREVIAVPGYRVRVYSGNSQTKSKNEAYRIEAELKQYMPELETTVVFKTPNWRLLVGNYRTMEEAVASLRVLKKNFPVFGREMFVVNDEIEIAL